jgi:membrane fusion protein, multidrug efflux system
MDDTAEVDHPHEHEDRHQDQQSDHDEKEGDGGQKKPKSRLPIIILIVVAVIAIIGGLIYWLMTRNEESTDDAYTEGNAVSIAPKVSGYVVDNRINDNVFVHAGDLLLKIDPRDYIVARDQAQANRPRPISMRHWRSRPPPQWIYRRHASELPRTCPRPRRS